jgi:small subunit ribosomal protein S17
MATTETPQAAPETGNRRNEKVGNVVSTKMQKTIVVEVEMRKAHPKYKRIVKSSMPTTSRTRHASATWFASARPVR